MKHIQIWTDGSCRYGVGGYGIVWKYKKRTKEYYKGFRSPTNNKDDIRADELSKLATKGELSVDLYYEEYIKN